MRKLVLSLCLTLMLLAVGHGYTAIAQTTQAAVGNAQQEIKTLQGQLVQAILKSDTSFLEKYYADDYIAIHGDGKLTTKAQEIDNFKSGVTKYDSITVREAKIRIYGDTAVVNALASVTTIVNGKPFSGDVRNTRVWVKDNGNWKLVVFQTTRVAP
ncbi:MAG: nuclear transport factor 2 family protein [Acidobacteriia bacterium]|nr:nuclear transport factor 2 family protein [Terriglobia bacterium]